MAEEAAPYMARVLQNAGTFVMALVNDVPIYDKAVMDFSAPTFHGCPWLIPGENEVVIEVEEAPLNPEFKTLAMFELCFFWHVTKIDDEKNIFHVRYPDLVEKLPPDRRKFPIRSEPMKFTPEGYIPEPIWANAPKQSISAFGSPELLQPLKDLHSAFERRDVDAFLEVTSTKIEDMVRYTGPTPDASRDNLAQETSEFFGMQWDLRPFEPEKLKFRSCCEGRVVYVTDDERGPALFAQHKTEKRTAWRVKPYLVRQGNSWRIFR